MRKLSPIAATLLALFSHNVLSQEAQTTNDANEALLDEVATVGYMHKGVARALEIQKTASSIVNVVSADGIGKLPDRNAAEAVQRMPGVSIERDQGEGRFVAVRGLPSQWNSTTLNGSRLPTAEEETTSRAVAFDFFPSDMIESVEVAKAIRPDMEGDAIGGSVNFITRRAPEEQTLSVNVGVGDSELAEGGSTSFNVLYGDRSDNGKFGYLVNATMWQRDWATDNYEPRRDGLGVHRLELRDYVGTRTTYGLNGAAEYLLDDGLIYAKALFGSLHDEETHYKHRVRYDKNRVELQHIYNELITEMSGFQVGGEHDLNATTGVDWSLATYTNKFFYGDIPNSADGAYYVVKFKQNVEFDGDVGMVDGVNLGDGLIYNTIDGGTDPALGIGMHLSDDWQMDPSQVVLADVELYDIDLKEKDKIVAELNVTHRMGTELEFKAGLKYRDKERSAMFFDKFFAWNETEFGPTPTLQQVADDLGVGLVDQPGREDFLSNFDIDYQRYFSTVLPVEALKGWWDDNQHKLTLLEGDSEIPELGGGLSRNFDLQESHMSVYGMATYTPSDNWTVLGGLRLTQTDTQVNGYVKVSDENGTRVEPAEGKKDYLSVLPSLHVTYSPDENTNYRLALTRTFARPDFGQLSPGATYLEIENELSSGNPELAPTYSNNLDLMYEYYFGDTGIVSLGYFYKQIIDPVFNQSYLGTYRGQTVTVTSPLNGDDATLHGVELAFNTKLSMLGSWADSFGFTANATFMDSDMDIPGRDDKVSISRQADSLYNIALYYDDGTFAARVAVNHKGAYIENHGSSADYDTYYGEYTSVDATASYQVTDKAMIYLELNNLSDEPLQYYTGSEARPNQIEYYGIKGQIGIRYDFF
ncbi:TonB-dependent receptor [Paraglaciecola hydrolytica]|uniref:TonB-dependent receptor n=1 Tax=Paraglaciecola hydrolytica TaxID=1799789 RepID=A0A148KKT0_9ALTE|nr:TonB-dependent receptor [Paraglaciecola hydrolytica]KXI26932.1 TonB-dependent receptor [Paraglaciecola hydrolytica]